MDAELAGLLQSLGLERFKSTLEEEAITEVRHAREILVSPHTACK